LALDSKGAAYFSYKPHLEQGQPLRPVAVAAWIPSRAAQRWLRRYQKIGLIALVRKKRADRGERRAASAQIKKAIEGLALRKPPLPLIVLYRQF
jgi:putative transposase